MTKHRRGALSERRRAGSLAFALALAMSLTAVLGAGIPANAQQAISVVASGMTATEGACHVTVLFSGPVVSADAGRHASYALDRVPLTESVGDIDVGGGDTTTQAVILLTGAGAYDPASVPIGCPSPVAVRDRWTVRPFAIRVADGSSLVNDSEAIVRADTRGPRLSAATAVGGNTVWIRSDEALDDGAVKVTLSRSGRRMTQTAQVRHGDTGFSVAFSFPPYTSYKATEVPFTQPPWLYPGDRITIARNQVSDRAGNGNAALSYTVAADTAPPKARVASLSHPVPPDDGTAVVDLAVRWSEPVRGCGFGPNGAKIDLGKLQVDVDGDGFAEYALDGFGAAGAGVAFVRAPDGSRWSVPGTAACDQSWWESQGTLVARLTAPSPDLLPRAGSVLRVRRGAADDIAGNPNGPHVVTFALSPTPLR